MSEAKQIMPVIELYLTDLIRRVIEEVRIEKQNVWADREIAEACGL